jgi:hypothetical protein
MVEEMRPAPDEVVEDLEGAEDSGIVIIEERDGPPRRRWVRYVMPVMVEVDPGTDRITRVVTLPEEIRNDRDEMGDFLVYDEKFIRRRMDYNPVDQPELHAWNVADPQWNSRFRVGGPARALRLSEDERAYLFELSGKEAGRPGRRPAQRVRPQLQRLLDDLTNTPAMVLGRCTDILAWNPLGAALFTDFALLPKGKRNFVRLVFCDPAVRAMYVDWDYVAQACVAQLRMEAARDPGNPRLTALVGELSVRDPDFRAWWGDHRVAARTAGTKALRHPVAGELALDWSTLTDAADPDQQLIALTAAPGTPTHDSLRLLGSWAAVAAERRQPHG